MNWVVVMILLSLLHYLVTGMLVGRARGKYKVVAPAITGDPIFERYFRVQQNSLETLVVFIPAVWLFAWLVNPLWAALLGAVFVVGRVVYTIGYIMAPLKRELGAMITFGVITVLVLGSLFEAIRELSALQP
jgi:glutathione S-transferase